jgi:hypothetical protein
LNARSKTLVRLSDRTDDAGSDVITGALVERGLRTNLQ